MHLMPLSQLNQDSYQLFQVHTDGLTYASDIANERRTNGSIVNVIYP